MNRSKLALLVLTLFACPMLDAAVKHNGLATCTRSGTLLACEDGQGSYYSVRTEAGELHLRGYDRVSRRLWAQTNSRYGQMTFFTGLASDGETWVGYSRRVGWTTLNRVSSSSGQHFNLHCSLIGGCR
ncbi:glutamine synthetase [Pseudomonas sp. S75]|uniref:glutamine synthetase n=1 Tax=unclassified Pseudomonas TaxID=196821 RepID=UPI001907E8A3|nr:MULTISPECIES: glutamine synthetase [unclassified Pseudomonas]MBJ9974425.1 glutamine synthetase [Pseudomonas sp. S30]MBK0154266.1 glutamine synthetase [Pseudomonas sp. S75]